jgi:hypothetical protein
VIVIQPENVLKRTQHDPDCTEKRQKL